MSYRMNYSNVDESNCFDPLPIGKYNVVIDKIQETTTKSSGKPMVKVRYKVSDGKYVGRIIFDNITLFFPEDKGAGITKHFLHVIGEPYEGEFDISPDNWIGKSLSLVLKIDDQWNTNKVASHNVIEAESIPF